MVTTWNISTLTLSCVMSLLAISGTSGLIMRGNIILLGAASSTLMVIGGFFNAGSTVRSGIGKSDSIDS